MKMVWFFIISALVHSLILTLPVSHDLGGQGTAMPVTLVLAPQKAAPEKTLSKEVTKPQIRESLAKKITSPKLIIKKQTRKKAIKKPAVKKLAKVRRPKRSKSPKEKKAVTIAASPKDTQKEQTERPPQKEDAFSHLELEDFFTPEPTEPDPTDESTMKVAKVSLVLKRKNKLATTSPPESKLHEATKGVNFLGNSDKASLFVGVRYARVAKPKYPRHARKMGWEGTTLLRVLVNQKGKTKFIEISRSSGFTTLDKAAIKAVKRWRFHPARSGNQSVESWVKIPIVFDLEELKK
jgi:protein TonB